MQVATKGQEYRTLIKRMPYTLRVGNIPGGNTEFVSIQLAANYAASQGGDWTILMYPGAYAEQVDLTAAPGVNLCGIDKESCIITVADGQTGVTMGAGCSVRNLTFDVTVTGTTSIGVETGDASCTVEDCNFTLQRTGGVVAVGINENTAATARDIYIRNVRMHSLVATNITGVYIQQANKTVHIENCWCEAGDYSLRVVAISTVYSAHNHWESLSGVNAVVLTAAGTIQMLEDSIIGTLAQTAGTMTYRDAHDIWHVFAGMYIQDSLTAGAGGEVHLHEGNHTPPNPGAPGPALTVAADTKVKGSGKNTIINGAGAATNINDLMLLNGDNITVRDIKFVIAAGCGTGAARPNVIHAVSRTMLRLEDLWIVGDLTVGDDGVWTNQCGINFDDTDHSHIEGCHVDDNVRAGICLRKASPAAPRFNKVIGNTANGNMEGIYLEYTSENVIANNEFIQNVDGIYNNRSPNNLISGNLAYRNAETGIALTIGSDNCTVTGNNCIENDFEGNTAMGIFISGSDECAITGNECNGNGLQGILVSTSDFCTVSGNTCANSYTENGIMVNNSSNNLISGNMCSDNGQHGIEIDGAAASEHNSLEGNYCVQSDDSGIYCEGFATKVSGNYCYNNSQATPGADHGIYMHGGSDYSQVNDNYCGDDGTNQQHGIYLAAGLDNCQFNGNYCYNNMGSGIYLAGTDDHNQIKNNYCESNDDYGIQINQASCTFTTAVNNKLINNGLGAILDNGTDTILAEVTVNVPNPDGNIGAHPADVQTDGLEVLSRLEAQLPMEFQELVRAHMVVVPGGTGNYRRSAVTHFGKLCVSEVYNVHNGAIAEGVVAVTASELECIDITDALTVTGATADAAAGDSIGIEFTRHADDALDTVDADCHLLKVRIQYV